MRNLVARIGRIEKQFGSSKDEIILILDDFYDYLPHDLDDERREAFTNWKVEQEKRRGLNGLNIVLLKRSEYEQWLDVNCHAGGTISPKDQETHTLPS